MPFSAVISGVRDLVDEPSEKIDEEAGREDAEQAQAGIEAANVQEDLAKRIFSVVDAGPGGNKGAQAHIDVYRHVPTQRGGKQNATPQRVEIGGTPLQEYRFIITNTNFQNAERFSVRSTFGDAPEIAHSFGEKPKIWQFNGILRSGSGNTKWHRAMKTFYRRRLRPTKMMRDNEFIRFRVGDLSLRGYIMNFNTSQSEKMDPAMARFQFSMYVRSFRFLGAYSYEPASTQLSADNPVFQSN